MRENNEHLEGHCTRRELLRRGALAAAAPLVARATALAQTRPAAQRPNFLWLTCEDLSPILGCYGDAYAHTPNLDAFARTAVRFDHAYAPAPVCSPARTGLLFGRDAVSLGANNHRSRPPTDPRFRSYAAHLREAGYWTANLGKTDYNSVSADEIIKDSWDSKGTWRDRPKESTKPFLSVINYGQTHASFGMVIAYPKFQQQIQKQLTAEEIHDPARAPLPAWMPDTPVMRRTIARYYDCVTVMDKEVGKTLQALEADGLTEDTIVFFYSDHGTGLPRGKQTCLDSGLRAPLLVRVPEKFRHLLDAGPGSTSDRMVSFVDFGPSLFTMAGLAVPDTMAGRPFMPPSASAPREVIFGARDRLDEAYDVQRTVRDKRYRYLRNYFPHVPHLQQNNYWRNAESAEELFAMHRAGKLPPAAAGLFGPRAPEELYDLQADPSEMTNLASHPAQAQRLAEMRRRLAEEMRRANDLCMVPEPEWIARAGGRPLTELAGKDFPLEEIITAADAVGLAATATLMPGLKHAESMVRWWTVVALRQNADDAATAALQSALADEHPMVSGEAALALVARDAPGGGEAAVRLLGSVADDYAKYLARMSIYSGPRKRVQPLLEAALAARGGAFGPMKQALRALEQLSD